MTNGVGCQHYPEQHVLQAGRAATVKPFMHTVVCRMSAHNRVDLPATLPRVHPAYRTHPHTRTHICPGCCCTQHIGANTQTCTH